MADTAPSSAERPVAAAMRRKLEQAFQPETLEIKDDSYKHAGHMGYKGDDAETRCPPFFRRS